MANNNNNDHLRTPSTGNEGHSKHGGNNTNKRSDTEKVRTSPENESKQQEDDQYTEDLKRSGDRKSRD